MAMRNTGLLGSVVVVTSLAACPAMARAEVPVATVRWAAPDGVLSPFDSTSSWQLLTPQNTWSPAPAPPSSTTIAVVNPIALGFVSASILLSPASQSSAFYLPAGTTSIQSGALFTEETVVGQNPLFIPSAPETIPVNADAGLAPEAAGAAFPLGPVVTLKQALLKSTKTTVNEGKVETGKDSKIESQETKIGEKGTGKKPEMTFDEGEMKSTKTKVTDGKLAAKNKSTVDSGDMLEIGDDAPDIKDDPKMEVDDALVKSKDIKIKNGQVDVKNGGKVESEKDVEIGKNDQKANLKLDMATLKGQTIKINDKGSVDMKNDAKVEGKVDIAKGGILSGKGTVTGKVTSSGKISPGNSPGVMHITDGLTLTETSELFIEIGWPGDLITIDGDLLLAGTLTVDALDPLTIGDSFTFLTAGSIIGEFDEIVPLGNFTVVPSYTATTVSLTVTAVPEPLWACPAMAAGLLLLRRRAAA